ncbi:cytochrome c3 family protein [Nitrosomonas supralitoralis]|uniref:FHA domain-containing protein n=1 Tax=Nitrosomonas supralitoralis TaxID=2116706 RepID=A0A2P7NU13_9PROT|nr:cytochrome c3 family protein [Nitrosomonas supralitoralis]PSJ16935.1 hypothetical protein C7H79_10855 [Nitrosomonas supralitoralis]
MHFLIYHTVRTDKDTGNKTYQQFKIRTQQLTIGRASDQHVQIDEPLVELCHATISLSHDGQLYAKSLTSGDIEINGESHRSKQLTPGDSIHIGSIIISIEQPRTDHPVVVSIDHPVGANRYSLESLHYTVLGQTRLSKSFWSWMLAVSIMLLFFIIPISGLFSPSVKQLLRESILLPDDSLWLTGPLHRSHQIIGKDCNACHTTPFKMVQNQQCIECHRDIQHHVDVASHDIDHFHENRCADCHREHNEPSILVQPDQRFCVDCHQNLEKLKNDTELADVSDFDSDHPEFSLTLLKPFFEETQTRWEAVRIERNSLATIQEESNLWFSHKEHLNPEGIRSPDGDKLLVCKDCHRPNTSGRQMLPINMEKHCAECHRLDLDKDNLGKQVPHGDLNTLFDTLKEYFSHQYLGQDAVTSSQITQDQLRRPNLKNKALSIEDRKQAMDWAEKQSLIVAQDLIEKRVCIDCHHISKIPGKTEFEKWYVKPVALNKRWMPLANFNHAKHTGVACISCHKNAKKSKKSSDILIPEIETCRECHGGNKDKYKLPSDCLMCHKFHLPNRGLLDKTQQTVTENLFANKNSSKPMNKK